MKQHMALLIVSFLLTLLMLEEPKDAFAGEFDEESDPEPATAEV